MGLLSFLETPQHWLRRADTARDKKQWDEAASFYRRFLASNSQAAEIWIQYGHALKESGQFDSAFGAYSRALSIAPDNSDAHLQLGHLQKITGRISDALNSYRRSEQIDANRDATRELEALRVDSDADRQLQQSNHAAPSEVQQYIRQFGQQIEHVLTQVATVKAISFEVAQMKRVLPLAVNASPYETMKSTATVLISQLNHIVRDHRSTPEVAAEIDQLIESLTELRSRVKNAR